MPDVAVMEAYAAACSPDDRESAIWKAQDVMYDGWERKTSAAQKAAARRALGISPLCADAYNLLADHATNPEAAADLYRLGIKAGELALGPEGFAEYDGFFWGALETRPYMRARHGLALTLLELGDKDGAIAHFRAMLDLNPGDNQGVRYLLLAQFVSRDDITGAKALLSAYADEWSLQWLYTKALFAYREGRARSKAARDLLKNAFEANPHVPAILAGAKPAFLSRDGFIVLGSPAEATDYLVEFGGAWKKTEGAVAWLVAAQEAES